MGFKAHYTPDGLKKCSAEKGKCPYGKENHVSFKSEKEFKEKVQSEMKLKNGLLPSVSITKENKKNFENLKENANEFFRNESYIIFQDEANGYIVSRKTYEIDKTDLSDGNLMSKYAKIMKNSKSYEVKDKEWEKVIKQEVEYLNN